MQLSFTPKAASRLQRIFTEKGSHLSLRIRIRRTFGHMEWAMTLEPSTGESVVIDGIPVLADAKTWRHLEGLIIDWIRTPEGEGFGIYDRNLAQRDLRSDAK